jgi:hypothetical protein
MIRSTVALVLLASVFVTPVPEAVAQTAAGATAPRGALPPAREVIARYVEAFGGRDALVKHTSMHSTGTFEIASMGMRGTMESFSAKPNRVLIKVTFPGMGEMRQGFDGEVGWSIDPASGPNVLEGRQLAERKQDSDFLNMLHEAARFSAMETVERVTFEGKDAYKVKLTRTSGDVYHEFFDVESGLLVGSIVSRESPMGRIEATSVMADYKTFGGVLLPTRITQKGAMGEIVITINSVEFDNVAPETFALPPEIKSLAGK